MELQKFKEARNEMREFLQEQLNEYIGHLDKSEHDEAHKIRHSVLPYSHMFYVIDSVYKEYAKKEEYLDGYNWVRLDQYGVKRLDLFMEDYWKNKLLHLVQTDITWCNTDKRIVF